MVLSWSHLDFPSPVIQCSFACLYGFVFLVVVTYRIWSLTSTDLNGPLGVECSKFEGLPVFALQFCWAQNFYFDVTFSVSTKVQKSHYFIWQLQLAANCRRVFHINAAQGWWKAEGRDERYFSDKITTLYWIWIDERVETIVRLERSSVRFVGAMYLFETGSAHPCLDVEWLVVRKTNIVSLRV